MNKKWRILSDKLSTEDVCNFAKAKKISPVIAALLLNRGINENNMDKFLSAGAEMFYDPFLLKDMDKAVKRIKKAVGGGEKITIYGDYDVDGITSVAMLTKYLKKNGAICTYYIPEREDEGYGLNKTAIEKIKKGGTSLIITVDNGISAVEEAEFAGEIGVDLVITDHHACSETIPVAEAVVNPKRSDCKYPFKELAGAGVGFKLVCALEGDSRKALEEYCEFVALATVADVVSLKDENRAIVLMGMKKMREENIAWFDALCNVSGIQKDVLNSYHIGFMLAPRINAAGRIGSAYTALKLLMEEKYEKAMEIAEKLNFENIRRKELGNNIFDEAVEMIESGNYKDKKVIVLAKEGWHSGIIGIIASRIADVYGKNVFLLSINGDETKGSGRGVEGLSLYEALSCCAQYLTKFGGHAMAAGLSLETKNIKEFERAVNEYADSKIEGDIVLSLDIDCRLSCEGDLLKLIEEIGKLEPFGCENERPVFAVTGAVVQNIRKTRDGKHLMMRFEKGGKEFSSIGFGMGDEAEYIKTGDTISIAARLEKNEYMGNISPQFHIIDLAKER